MSHVVCLRHPGEPEDSYREQVQTLGAFEWAPADDVDADSWVQQAAAAITARTGGEPVHVIASGRAVPRALMLAVRHAELVISVLADDPVVDEDDPTYWELLRGVRAPTLVLVAAPTQDTDTSQAQTIAGGVDNGVMVIIDGAAVPVHRQASHSFHEWVTSFMSIAEGLRALASEQQSDQKEEQHA